MKIPGFFCIYRLENFLHHINQNAGVSIPEEANGRAYEKE
jgi:hypothetical protein